MAKGVLEGLVLLLIIIKNDIGPGRLLPPLLRSLPGAAQIGTLLGLASSLSSLRHHRVLLLFVIGVILIASQLLC